MDPAATHVYNCCECTCGRGHSIPPFHHPLDHSIPSFHSTVPFRRIKTPFASARIKCRRSHNSALLPWLLSKAVISISIDLTFGLSVACRVKMADDYGVTFYDCKLSQKTAGSPPAAKRELIFIVIILSDHPCLQWLIHKF